MINFRFHLVSLIAIFLALGLGVLMGSTVVDQAIVDRLDREISDVRAEASARGAENDELRDELDRAQDLLGALAPFAVEDRLRDVPVAVLVERGVDDDAVDAAVALLDAAGAQLPGVVWFDDRWRLAGDDDVADLRAVTNGAGSTATVRRQALQMLAQRLAGVSSSPSGPDGGAPPGEGTVAPGTEPATVPPTVPPTSAPPVPGAATELLRALAGAGFVELEDFPRDLPGEPWARMPRVLLVTGTDSSLLGTGLTEHLAASLQRRGVGVVVAEVYEDHGDVDAPGRGDLLAPIRQGDLGDTVSTVDTLDRDAGRIAVVLALEALAVPAFGHYGAGTGAAAPLPASSP
jgi:hypothetical protein